MSQGANNDSLRQNHLTIDIDLAKTDIPHHVLQMVDVDVVTKYQVLPLHIDHGTGTLTMATDKVENMSHLPYLTKLLGHKVSLRIADEMNIRQGIAHHYNLKGHYNTPVASMTLKTFEEDAAQDDEKDTPETTSSRETELVDSIIKLAILRGASDIHISPREDESKIFFRLDGEFLEIPELKITRRQRSLVVNIIKLKCKPALDPSNTKKPQDGAFMQEIASDKGASTVVDFRVSTVPTVVGIEKVVIRLLDTSKGLLTLDAVGFTAEDQRILLRLLERPSGMILVTGPTGSGKTTTLYASLLTYGDGYNICTVEDPVEIKVPKFTQVSVRITEDPNTTLTFEKAMNSFLRQDPDIILVGEIRTAEAANIAVRASQTGHMVFSTLHTKGAIASVTRLFALGVERAMILSEMVAILSQRLVRQNCPNCSRKYTPSEKALSHLTDEEKKFILEGNLMKGDGCTTCFDTGFSGRTAVAEILEFDDETRDFFSEPQSLKKTSDFLFGQKKFKSMWDKGLWMVRDGHTTLEELLKVIRKN